MANLGTLEAVITADDAELLSSLDNIAKSAKKMQHIFENAFNTSAATKAEQQVNKLGKSTKQVGAEAQKAKGKYDDLTSSVKGLAAAYLSVEGIKRITAMADQYKLVEGQLKNVVSNANELKDIQKDLFDISQRTKSSYAATAGLYAKMARVNGDLGRSTKDLLKMTEITNKALIVSGADAQERTSVIKQLSQALGSGVLRGEEFNAIMENGSRVAMALADSLGVTVGQLREMATNGELTSQVVVDALLKQGSVISLEYLKMGKTVSGAWEQVRNAALQYVGDTDKSISATNAFATVLTGLANNFDAVANSAALLGMAIAGGYGGAAIARGIKQLTALRLSLLATTTASRGMMAAMGPIGWAALAGSLVASVGSAMLATRDFTEEVISSDDVLAEYAERIKELKGEIGGLDSTMSNFKGGGSSLKNFANIDRGVLKQRAMVEEVKKQWEDVWKDLSSQQRKALEAKGISKTNIDTKSYEELYNILVGIEAGAEGLATKLDKLNDAALTLHAVNMDNSSMQDNLSEAEKVMLEYRKQVEALNDLKIHNNYSSGMMQFIGPAREAIEALNQGRTLTQEQADALNVLSEKYGETNPKISAYRDEIIATNEALKKKNEILSQEKIIAAQKQYENSLSSKSSDEDLKVLAYKERQLELARMSREEQELLNIQKRVEKDLAEQIGQEQAKIVAAQIAQEVYDAKELQKTVEEIERLNMVLGAGSEAIYNFGSSMEQYLAAAETGAITQEALNDAIYAKITALDAEAQMAIVAAIANGEFNDVLDEHSGIAQAAQGAMAATGNEALALGQKALQAAAGVGVLSKVMSSIGGSQEGVDVGVAIGSNIGDALKDYKTQIDGLKLGSSRGGGGKKKGGGGKSKKSQEDKDIEKTLKDLQGPLDEYNEKLESLNKAKVKGKITTEQYDEAMKRLGRDMVGAGPTVAKVKDELRLLDEMLANGTISWEEYSEKTISAMTKLPGVMGDLASEMKNLSEGFSDAFADMIVDAESFSEGFSNVLKSMAKNLISTAMTTLSNQAVTQFMGMLSGSGGLGGGLMGSIGGLLGFADGGKVQKYATGGFVSGSGTSRSDSIPAMLSNGEYVVNAKATKAYAPLLQAINQGNLEDLIYRAKGGFANVMNTTNAVTKAASSGKLAQGRGGNINLGGITTGDTHITIQSSGDAEVDQKAIAEAQKQFQKNNEKQIEITFLKLMNKYKM